MVDKEVLRHFVIAVRHLDNAKFAEPPRHAIAEGPQLTHVSLRCSSMPVRLRPAISENKLDSFASLHPGLLDSYRESTLHGGTLFVQSIPWKKIEAFYRDWLAARYEVVTLALTTTRRRPT